MSGAPTAVAGHRPRSRAAGAGASVRERERAYAPASARRGHTPASLRGAGAPPPALREEELTALWLLGRVPARLLPWPCARPGRAGRGGGPDVREAAFLLPSGVVLAGDVEVHLHASDFARHGHEADAAYAGVLLHLVWEDDRPAGERGGPTALPGGGAAPTVAVGAALGGDPARLRALLRRGPAGGEPCAGAARQLGDAGVRERVRAEGRRRLAERSWRAARLAAERGWAEAWRALLERALASSAGRRREEEGLRAELAAGVDAGLGEQPLEALRALALAGEPRALSEGLRALGGAGALGAGRAAEVGWNAALPLLAAMAAAYDDLALARATARLAERWPAPRPYGRTRALASLLGAEPGAAGGALYAQGLLHLQELWCERAGCGQCPLSAPGE